MNIKVLQEIKDMGKPSHEYYHLEPFQKFSHLLEIKCSSRYRYRGRIITNWDFECNKVCQKLVINYATYYKHNTKKELYKMASDNRIAGRSHMNKKPLIVALMKL